MTQLELTQFLGSPHLVDEADGVLVRQQIAPLLQHKETVLLSFQGAETVTTSFLNRAVGDLYQTFPPDVVDELLRFENMDEEDLRRALRVREFAKEFYRDPEAFQIARQEALADVL